MSHNVARWLGEPFRITAWTIALWLLAPTELVIPMMLVAMDR